MPLSPSPSAASNFPWEESSQKRYPPPDPSIFTEYEKIYPPDKYGEELTPNARVWKIYRDRARDEDEDRVRGWHETLNVLLIFAGLFSAVTAAFVLEATRPGLPTAVSYYLFSCLQSCRSRTSPGVCTTLFTPTTPTKNARLVNELWSCGLALTLITAFFLILIKQWLVKYTSNLRSPAGDSLRWAQRHYALRRGLSQWRVDSLISWTAACLYISLFLFLAGLALFFRDLDLLICGTLTVLVVATLTFYVGSTVAPLIWPECPSRTQFLGQLETAVSWSQYLLRLLFTICYNITLYISIIGRASLEWLFHRNLGLAWNIQHELRHKYAANRRVTPCRRSWASDSRLLEGREAQLTNAVILSLLSPENDLDEVDIAVALDAVGAIDVEHTGL
ncbi:hypothetical protein BKA62DRAFT_814139, partial [Auriculariales sp. MPI-PUGE-AT-0066]